MSCWRLWKGEGEKTTLRLSDYLFWDGSFLDSVYGKPFGGA